MARREKGYSVNTKKKVITKYTNVKRTDMEEREISDYIQNGYKVKYEKKINVAEMRRQLKKDEKALKEFNALYSSTVEDGGACAFHSAMQYYQKWAKANKNKTNSEETTEE